MIGHNFTNWGWSRVACFGDVETGSSSTQSASPDVRQLVDTLAKGIKGQYSPTGSTYVAPSSTTQSGWSQALNAANNPGFSSDVAGALSSYGNRAAGNELGINDPLYAAQRARLTDNVMTETNSAFNGAGLFGSDQNQAAAARGLSEGLSAADLAQRTESYSRQAEAADKLGTLFNTSLLPSSVTGAIGGEMDADAQAKALGNIDYQKQFMNLLTGASGAAGTNTTQNTPWWKAALGTAATIGSFI